MRAKLQAAGGVAGPSSRRAETGSRRARPTAILQGARECREALLRGRFEPALEALRRATRSLGERDGSATEIAILWKAACRLLRAVRRLSGDEHLARHGRTRPDRLLVEAAQFDVGTLLEIARARLTIQPEGRRWFRRSLRDLERYVDPDRAWRRLVHLAVRLTRSDRGVLLEIGDGEPRIRTTADALGMPLPRHTLALPRGAILASARRARLVLPGWRCPEGGRRLVLPVPLGEDEHHVLYLDRCGRAPRYGEERRLVLRSFLTRAGPTAAEIARRVRRRESEDRERREDRRRHLERAEERARQRRFLASLRSARRGESRARSSLRFGYERIVGTGGRMGEILRNLDRVIPTDLPLLLLGETGTGKELVARAIHDYSPRASGPFVSVNAAALPESLVEVELFGCRRGAYTDAYRDREGRLRAAHRGTFFLDEIGEMSLGAQGKLLRVIESGRVRPVGGGTEVVADIRLIAATNRNLEERVEEGHFREDLYHRIRVVPIELPPLRERLEDLPLLVQHFLESYAEGEPPAVSDAALDRLRAHRWPGNIRELEMCLRVALVLCDGPRLQPEHIQIQPPVRLPDEGGVTAEEGLSVRQVRLLDEWPEDEPIRCGAYARRYRIPSRTASRDLSQLAERGFLEKVGAGAGTRYYRVVGR